MGSRAGAGVSTTSATAGGPAATAPSAGYGGAHLAVGPEPPDDAGPDPGRRLDLELTAGRLDAVAHPGQPVAARPLLDREAHPAVVHPEPQLPAGRPGVVTDLDRDTPGAGVPVGVVHGLEAAEVDGRLDVGG